MQTLPTRGPSYENTAAMLAVSNFKYELISVEDAILLLETMDEFALDFETTSLFPEHGGKIRITSICNDDHHFIVDHFLSGPFEKLIPSLRGKVIWVYNAKFESKWLDCHCPDDAFDDLLDVRDVDFLAKAKIGGYPSSLATMARRDLKIMVDKTQQNSGWGDLSLTTAQLDYAAFDSHVTWELFKYWNEQLTDEQYEAAMFVFNDSVRGTVEAESTGMWLDCEAHEQTIALWETKLNTFKRYLRKHTPESLIKNLNSNPQLGKFVASVLDKATLDNWPKTDKKKELQLEGKYLRAVSRQFPYPFSRWLAALAGYKYYSKYLSTYGDVMLNSAQMDVQGKVYTRFNIGQAATGRYSSSSHNLQNIPRKIIVRKAFVSVEGKKMILADYKGIEVRVLAEVSCDAQLLHDAIYSDVHAASASAIYGYELDYVLEVLASEGEGKYANIYPIIKEQRSKAKAFTFQLVYGAGAGALSDVLRCTYEEAVAAIDAWAARYPNAFGYRNVIFQGIIDNEGYLPVHDGRTIRVFKDKQTLPVAANYGVQGAAASVMYRCMYNAPRMFSNADVPAWVAATVHDELISYADEEFAEEAHDIMCAAMVQSWLDIFPDSNTDNLLDSAIGTSWAAKP